MVCGGNDVGGDEGVLWVECSSPQPVTILISSNWSSSEMTAQVEESSS